MPYDDAIWTKVESRQQNYLLAGLADEEWLRWKPHLELVDLSLGEVLHESNIRVLHAYFPTTALVSLLAIMEDGASVEVAVVGNDGLVGVAAFMGGGSTPTRAVVQVAGKAYRMAAWRLREEFDRTPVLHLLLHYTQALLTQMAQTTVCNRHHALDQQLYRWLLLSLDRQEGNELVMTHELIANMLGVRRESISVAAKNLQKDGLISYKRGHITVFDRPGLEARACECYQVVKAEYDRLLPRRAGNSSGVNAA